ncbi:large subunit ribosomal protein L32 [Saccharopolyspora lacisalsi]|uniref:Large ribosomal subunit protein bL32 n=1 Tax=Halosaccharopolyspora lacisalsi TaxID=1000566 RepID=A0A839DVB1_9PSEU|nr:50S ribosomal protein L32 [Halosaccharopolyspora lacisalsi]MBA8823225.1 large subunit ribosomal protein L32 [Halosaccharopolyspora lacisalsi]
MAVPKFKKSRSNTRKRRSQWKATAPTLVKCSNRACREQKPPHIACPSCGQHAGRQVVEPA